MALKKGMKLRTIFIKYIISVGILSIVLIIANLYVFFVALLGVYPANYSQKTIEKNLEKLKNTPKVTMDLLTPMCSFGVYSDNGHYLYGNFSDEDKKIKWENYQKGTRSTGYIISIEREEGILIVNYPLTMQYKSEKLREILPNAENTVVFLFFVEFIVILILWANRFAKKINNELKSLLVATEKIEEQDLDFNIGASNIKEIDMVLQGIDKMKGSLKTALEEQWVIEKQRQEQISALAHDVKTPLTVVKGNVGLLAETDMTEEQKVYCHYIEESSGQMEKYIQNLLAITKKESARENSNEIIQIIKILNLVKEQGMALGKTKNIDIISQMNIEEDLYIKGYENELDRALMNIIANAVDFSPDYSTITINSVVDNSQLIIRVIDEGEGFSEKMLKYGKEQLSMGNESRTKNGHYGLGLYIADTIIKKHNGELILSNSVNGGGKVIVKIPLLYE